MLLPYLNVLELESVNKASINRFLVIDQDNEVRVSSVESLGVSDYNELSNKPIVNGVPLEGEISSDALGLPSTSGVQQLIYSSLEAVKLTAGNGINITRNVISVDFNTIDKPTINGLPIGDNLTPNIDFDRTNVSLEINMSLGNQITSEQIPVYDLEKNLAGVLDTNVFAKLNDKYTKSEINESLSLKQDKLVSGDNIKTLNGNSLLGSGNIIIDTDLSDYVTKGDLNEAILPINSDIQELEISKQEVFQADYPLLFDRSNDDLVLGIDLSNKQDVLTAGDNIDITDNTISWVAPDVQFVNTIFTDDDSLKYAVSDFSGTYTEKEFPVATQESAGLMSAADKVKLDNYVIPYLHIGNSSIVSGSFADVYSAIQNNEPYLIKVYITGTSEIWGDPEQVYISGDNLEMFASYHPVDGSYIQVMWTVTPGGSVTKREWDLDLATQTEVDAKQDTLVSGTNIKTINGQNILGSGNILVGDGAVDELSDRISLLEVESVKSMNVNKIVVLTQTEYDALSDKDNYTLYIIK